ncbi:MAG: methyltransferase [Wenzhouxiangella sp.]|nr:methyltransferase [Wenzhouxiangella sp.]TVR95342.1 MAG: methyltransferase domain-containing protein [Wenzhouxiangellaceae bacterium]
MIRKKRTRLPTGQARSAAQSLAFAPFAFWAAIAMRDQGLLDALERAGAEGLSEQALGEASGLSTYAVSVLTDFALDIGLIERNGERLALAALGSVLLNDELTRVNMDFTRDFAYHGMARLPEALAEERPAGLAHFGPWATLYEGLSELKDPAASSWFRFDQFFSERAFEALVPRIFERHPTHVVDVGANTGNLASRVLRHDREVQVTLVDLPDVLALAQQRLSDEGLADRIRLHPAQLLDPALELPAGADAMVMSQLLACFSEPEIVSILKRAVSAMGPETRLYIIELFPDVQIHDAARYSLNAISLYFTAMATGNSRFYRRDQLLPLLDQAGLKLESEHEQIGQGHSLLVCRRQD